MLSPLTLPPPTISKRVFWNFDRIKDDCLEKCELAKVNGRPGEEKNFYRQFSIVKYSSLPRDTFKTYVERHVTRRKLSLKLTGYCRQTSYTDSAVVFTLLPAVAWVLKSQFAPGYMHYNICFEEVSGKI